jgi:hypothetical protein
MTLARNYAELQATAARWHGGSSDSLFADVVRDAIGLAEFDMDRTLWVPERVKRVIASCAGEYEALPDDCSRLIVLKRVASGREQPMVQQPEDAIPGLQQLYTGQLPSFYTLIGRQVQFAPVPTAQDPITVRFVYYATIPRLQDPGACTAILSTYGDVYLYTTLKHLAPEADDAQAANKWANLSQTAIDQANRNTVMRDAVLFQ